MCVVCSQGSWEQVTSSGLTLSFAQCYYLLTLSGASSTQWLATMCICSLHHPLTSAWNTERLTFFSGRERQNWPNHSRDLEVLAWFPEETPAWQNQSPVNFCDFAPWYKAQAVHIITATRAEAAEVRQLSKWNKNCEREPVTGHKVKRKSERQ